ncbi:MAG: alanine racemase [Actinobacteria bacterium]|jgi:alanine racemase|nr:alanine racemase [Actinomycetota bacterium]
MEHRAEARIDVASITANISTLKSISGVDLLAVVKADAYGHGLIEVGLAAEKAGADWLGVALLEEAIALRTHGVRIPILAWLLPPGSDFRAAHSHDIDVAVSCLATLEEISALKVNARIHIEVDTGMNRGGFLNEWPELLKADFSFVDVVGFFSHFARADEPEQSQNDHQLNRFNEMLAQLVSVGVNPPVKHLSNSAATLKNHTAAFDLVRTGIAMYGLSPDVKNLGDSASLGLLPAMQLRAKLHLVKHVLAGSPVGYGASAITAFDTQLGVVAMGYADGIPRVAQGAGVFFDNKRAPIIGRVSMDQFVVDLGPDSTAKSGDWVVIFGDGRHGEYTADDWGASSASINYEIVTRIGPRVSRIYAPHVY